MRKTALLLLLALASCGPKQTNKKVIVPIANDPAYQAEHFVKISFQQVAEDAFVLNQYTLDVQKLLVQANIEKFYNVDFEMFSHLEFGVGPIREQMANEVISTIILDIDSKAQQSLNPQVKVDLEILKDFLMAQKELNDVSLQENKIDLYFSFIAPIINLQLIESAQSESFKKETAKLYLKNLVEKDLYGKMVEEIDKMISKSPIKLLESKYNDLKNATLYAESYFETIDSYFTAYIGDELDKDLVKKLKDSYLDTSRKISYYLSQKGKIISSGTVMSKEHYQKTLRTHGVYLNADKMYQLAKSKLETEYKAYVKLAKKVAKLKALKHFSIEKLAKYYRKKELVSNDIELKDIVERSNDDITKIVSENTLLTQPQDPTVVFYAGLTDGELGELLKERSSHGVPQMIDSMPAASNKPFALWPEVKTMKQNMPDFIIKPAIHGVSAHEGRPGHEMQFLSIQMSEYRSIIRHKLIQNTANVEGWGLYSEKIIEEQLDKNDIEKKLFYKSNYIFRIIRVITDYEIAMGLKTPNEALDVYIEKLGVAKSTAQSEISRRVTNPGRDTGYFVGRYAIEQLKTKIQANSQFSYSDQCFNDLLIRYSFAPAKFVEKLINTTKNCLNTSEN